MKSVRLTGMTVQIERYAIKHLSQHKDEQRSDYSEFTMFREGTKISFSEL